MSLYNDFFKYFRDKLIERERELKNHITITKHSKGKHYMGYSTGISKLRFYTEYTSKGYGGDYKGFIVGLYMDGDNYKNKLRFFQQNQQNIENDLQKSLVWLDTGSAGRIFLRYEGDINDKDKWNQFVQFFIDSLISIVNIFKPYIEKLRNVKEIIMNYENQFKEWWFGDGSKKSNGLNYASNTKSSYFRELQRLKDKIGHSVFEVDNLEILNTLLQRLLSGDLKDYNNRLQNSDPSSGLQQYIKFIQTINEDIHHTGDLMFDNKIKNIILYGSPGVGKTHNTKKLISLIERGISEKEIFATIKHNEKNNSTNIDDLKDRVKFITFHQSFGYEDFIEGFRPNEEGNIGLEKGIFLEICKEAEANLLKSSEEIVIPFIDAFKTLFKDKIENEESVNIDLKRTGSFFKVNDFNDKTIYFEKQSGTTKHTLSMASLEKMYDMEENNFINGGLAVYYEPILNELLQIKRNSSAEKEERKNYYLVIDEINRGNISKIFGELITLIEEDKRDTLEVTLPYSKKPFKIPSNLYIIGTMNSTDKSIALIDIALRRRFTFLRMEPNADLVNYPQAKNIFLNLNEKIKETLGADYIIGHSYFMKVENDDDLDFVLEYKIKPLLEEYYYGDDNGFNEVLKTCQLDTDGNDNDE